MNDGKSDARQTLQILCDRYALSDSPKLKRLLLPRIMVLVEKLSPKDARIRKIYLDSLLDIYALRDILLRIKQSDISDAEKARKWEKARRAAISTGKITRVDRYDMLVNAISKELTTARNDPYRRTNNA